MMRMKLDDGGLDANSAEEIDEGVFSRMAFLWQS